MLTFVRSKIAKLYATFSFGGVPVDPGTLRIAIYHGDTIVIAPTIMTKISTGYWYYEFTVPTNWTEDFYDAVYTGIINGVTFKQDETFKVIASETITGGALPSTTYCNAGDVDLELAGVYYKDLANMDNYIAEMITDADEEVDRRCNRNFREILDTEYIDGNNSPCVYARRVPIKSVTLCELLLTPSTKWYTFTHIALINTHLNISKQIATPATDLQYAACDLIVDCIEGRLTIPERVQYVGQSSFPFWNYTFVEGKNNIRLTYTSGFNATDRPREIRRLAAKIVAVGVLKAKGDLISGGSTNISLDGVGHSYQGVPFGGRIELLETQIENIVRRYRKIGVS